MAKTNTTVGDYIKKFGEDVGRKEFARVLIARNKRESSVASGRSTYRKNITYTEDHILSGDAVKCQSCQAILPRIQWTHLKKCSQISIDDYKAKYPEFELVATNLKKKCSVTRENLSELYGDIGLDKFDSYRQKQADTNSFEYKAKKYGMTEEEFDAYNSSRACTRINLIARHGEEKGTTMWEQYVERQRYTTTLEYFVEEYGKVDGNEKYTDFCKGRLSFFGGKSIIEEEVYQELKSKHHMLSQHPLFSFSGGAYDMGCLPSKKLIEFYGDYWHTNPEIYDETFLIHGKEARDIWKKDEIKVKMAENNGYQVLIIWEKDWRMDKEAQISRALHFLNS